MLVIGGVQGPGVVLKHNGNGHYESYSIDFIQYSMTLWVSLSSFDFIKILLSFLILD